MNIEDSITPPANGQAMAVPAVEPLRSKKQIKASALVEGVAARAKWKTLVAEAKAVWPRLHAEELLPVGGSFPVLAGLVQLRYGISREESNQQARAFLDKHYPAA